VFFVEKKRGYSLLIAYLKQLWANVSMLSTVLYILNATPPLPVNSYTVFLIGDWVVFPAAGVKDISSFPGPWTLKSVALYWSPKECLPMMIGLFQFGMSLGIF